MEENLLDDELALEDTIYIKASRGQRFGNYMIDLIPLAAINLVYSFIFEDPLADDYYLQESNPFLDYGIGFLITFVYYFVAEGVGKGKSLGKFITHTRAATIEGVQMNTSQVAIRSLCRLIPFDAFSFLWNDAYGWHDAWSKTMVIDEKKSSSIKYL